MNKSLALIAVSLSLLAGCGKKNNPATGTADNARPNSAAQAAPSPNAASPSRSNRQKPTRPQETKIRSLFARNDGSLTARFPTTAATPPTQSEVIYSSKPTNNVEFYQGQSDFYRIGLKHFRNRDIVKVTPSDHVKAGELIETVIDSMYEANDTALWKQLNDQATLLEKNNYGLRHDAMFQFFHGIVATFDKKPAESTARLTTALDLFEHSDYPARMVVLNYRYLFKSRMSKIARRQSVQQIANYGVAVRYWVTKDFRAQPDQHRYVYDEIKSFLDFCLRNDDWKMTDQFVDVFTQQTHLPEWIRAMVRADYFTRLSWKHRGPGMANTVSKDGWKKFEEYQTKAVSFLKQGYDINPMFPESACLLMESSRAGHTPESEEEWFQKSIAAQVDFMPAYHARLFGLTPQWGGSVEEMIKFSIALVHDGNEDTLVPYNVLVCYQMIGARAATHDIEVRQSYLNDPELMTGILDAMDVLGQNENGLVINGLRRRQDFFLTIKAIYAKKSGDMQAAHDAFRKLGSEFDIEAARICGVTSTSFDAFRCAAYALTSEFESEALELNALMRPPLQRRLDNAREILSLCEDVLRENEDPVGSMFFKQAQRQVRMEKEFDSGKEIQFDFDPALLLWLSNDIRDLTFDSENSVIVDNRQRRAYFNLRSIVHTPGPKQVELEIEFPEDNQPETNYVSELTPSVLAGLIGEAGKLSFGISRDHRDHKTSRDKAIVRSGKFCFGISNSTGRLFVFDLELTKRKATLRYFIMPGYYEVYVNDQFIFRSNTPALSQSSPVLQLLQPASRKGQGKFRFSRIRMKKWDAGMPPFSEPPESLVEYYEKQLAANPRDKWNAFWLAQATHAAKDYDRAISHYQQAIDFGLPESVAAFYLGDANDQLENYKDAKKWYQVASNLETFDRTSFMFIPGRYPYNSDQSWAAFRLAWLNRTSSDPEIRKSHDENQLVAAVLTPENAWAYHLLKAQTSAVNEDFDEAAATARTVLKACTADQEKYVLKMIEAYDAKKIFVAETGERPFYLEFTKPFPLFRHLEEILKY